VLDGTMNLRDLGGWPVAAGAVTARGQLYRSDRLCDLTDRDHRRLEAMQITTVIDLRFEVEVTEHPSRLWSTVESHHRIPMGGDLVRQHSFVSRVLAGEIEGVTVAEVGEGYIELLQSHAAEFGRAVEALLSSGPALFHCTAGKDRTGLLSMLILDTVGVGPDDILADFELSNEYRAGRRIAELRPRFAAAGIDIERFEPALSAPRPAMEQAMAWLEETYRGAEGFLTAAAGVIDPGPRLRSRLLQPAGP
jgi:protein-tyrosine phosphatase